MFWMPRTRSVPSRNVVVRGLVTNGTWADGLNIHGDHSDILVEGCSANNSGDDSFAIWSHRDSANNITFRQNYAEKPRHPANSDRAGVSCFAVYGGNRSAFIDNRCKQTGDKGMIAFQERFGGQFAATASAVVSGNSVDEGKPLCGGDSLDRISAPGCKEAAQSIKG